MKMKDVVARCSKTAVSSSLYDISILRTKNRCHNECIYYYAGAVFWSKGNYQLKKGPNTHAARYGFIVKEVCFRYVYSETRSKMQMQPF